MTVYNPDRPKDLFQFYHPQIRKQFLDIINLGRIWIECLLYWKGIYPHQAFQIKTAYSKQIYVVKSQLIKQYLNRFFQSLSQNIENINYIEIEIYQLDSFNHKKLIECQRFQFLFIDKQTKSLQKIKTQTLNIIQKQILIKSFLTQIQNSLQNGYSCQSDKQCTFKLFMGYKWDHSYTHNRHKLNLLEKWTHNQKNNIHNAVKLHQIILDGDIISLTKFQNL